MIRVLQVIGAMDRGGAETMLMNLYRAIDRDRIQFDFLVHEHRVCDYDNEIQSLGGYVFGGLPRFSGANYYKYRESCKDFFSLHDDYPIVHGHISSCAPIYLCAAKKTGCKTIAHSHSQNYPLSIMQLGFRCVSYPVRFVADEFMACSREAGIDRFGKSIVLSDRFHILNNAIDTKRYECNEAEHLAAKAVLGFDSGPLIGHVGRFDPVKNHKFLILVFKKLLGIIPNAKLLLVGRGPDEDKIKQQVNAVGIQNNVIFFGITDQIPTIMKALDAFVFPSFSEGLSMAAIEAQCAGVPCLLSTGVPEQAVTTPQLVTRISLDKGEEFWAASIKALLANDTSRESGAIGTRHCGYDISDTAQWLMSYYENLAAC